jgi:transglutaminase-like putative cysteine protease
MIVSIVVNSHQNAWSQVLNNETRIIINVNGRKTTKRTVLVQINDKQANWLSHIEIRHNPKQDFSFNYARIIDPKGNTVRKFKKKDLTTRNDLSYQAFYQDNLITEFDLYWNQYPYQVEYSYTITEEEYLYVAWWTPLLYSNLPTRESSLEINAPSDYTIHISQSGDFAYNESKTEDRKIYYWESTTVKKTKDEIYSPPIRELIPMVSVVPSKFKYGVNGSLDSWSSFGSWLNDLNEGTDQLPLSEKIIIKKLVDGIDDKREVIKKIYYYLQDHTKYINVAIDVGGLKSYSASYVCQNKYGDCKALTTYMKSMLKSVGIESHYTVINAGKNEAKIKRNFPSQKFNHVILAIPLENDTIWLENTSNALPYNYLGTFTQNRYALAVNEEKSELVQTPKLQLSDVLVQRDYVFTVDERNVWLGDIKLTLRGSPFENFRYSISNESESDQEMEIINLVDIDGFDLDNWNALDYHRDSSTVKIHVRGDCPSPIREIGNWEVINPLKISVPDFEEPNNRHLDVRINYPINKSDKIVYKIKNLDDKEVKIPEGIIIKTIYGQYSTEYLRENNLIVCHEKLTIPDNDISVDKYPEFYSFIQSIIDHKKKSAILIK